MKLDGCVALVTGANQGLGKRYTEELLGRGARKVYACALDLDWLAPMAADHAGRIVPLRLDVTEPADIAAAVEAAPDLTVLFNNAGVLAARGLIEAGSCETFRREMEVNVFGLAQMCIAFAPTLARNGGGAIVNMCSVASLVAFPPFATYCATKAAAMSITHSLRYELKRQGTRVFAIYAGMVDTDMLAGIEGEKADPGTIAREAIDGVEAGILDIDAGERARAVRAALKADPQSVQSAQSGFADAYVEANSGRRAE